MQLNCEVSDLDVYVFSTNGERFECIFYFSDRFQCIFLLDDTFGCKKISG